MFLPIQNPNISISSIFNTHEAGVAVQPNATVTLCEIETSKLCRIKIIVYTKIAEPTINQTNGGVIGWFVEGKNTYPAFSKYLDGMKTINLTEVIDTPSAKMTFTAVGGICHGKLFLSKINNIHIILC